MVFVGSRERDEDAGAFLKSSLRRDHERRYFAQPVPGASAKKRTA